MLELPLKETFSLPTVGSVRVDVDPEGGGGRCIVRVEVK